MKTNQKLTYAITAVLSAYAGASFAAADNLGIEEVVVTAQRRSENIQNVPITMQAMSSETLSQLNVTTIEDMVKYLPNVSTATIGPGQGNIYMRGLSVGAGGTQGLGSIGNYPNVAVYLDDQPTQLPGRNLDVYAADMERIEVLEGPQGTLFGAGAQAGVVRYITNKPKIDKTEGKAIMGYGTTAHGDPNSSLEGMLNLPLIDGTLAVRAVVYTDRRGGYINNQASTLTRSDADFPWAVFGINGGHVPTDNVVGNNYAIAGSATNPLTYQGMRLSGLLKINEDWDVLLTQSYQNMDAQGVFYQQPVGLEGNTLPKLTNTTFSPSYDKDKFTNTALTVNGKIGALKAVYSGAYLVRNVDQVQDYSGYARGVYGYYYQCAIDYANDYANSKCYSPVSNWHDVERNVVQTHEFRLTTPDDLRVRGTVGLFYEKMLIEDDTAWNYKTVPNCTVDFTTNCFHPTQPFPGQPVVNPSSFDNPNLGFSDNYVRNFTQKAAFASVDFDLIPKQLTLTVGTRYYNMHDTREGGNPGSFYCKVFDTPTTNFGPCTTEYGNLQTGADQIEKGFKSRVNITWRPMDDTMFYATWSQGYRPGGFNRSTSIEPIGDGSYRSPATYAGDELTNKELGWKTELLNRRVQFNGAIYQEDWKNTQVGLFAPELGFGNLTFGLNGPTFRVKGLETQIIARVTEGLTLTGSASWNSSSQQNAPQLLGNVPGSDYYNELLPTGGASPFGKPGVNLAMSPPFQANLRARYEWTLGSYNAFWQLGGVHTAHSYTTTGNINNFELPSWTSYDGSAGVAKDNWAAEIFGSNLTNLNTVLFASSAERVVSQVPMRPRVLGLRLSFKF